MLKKVLALFVVIVLCLSVCACKNVSTDQPTQTTSNSAGNTQPTGNAQDTVPTVTTVPPETTKATETPETIEPTVPLASELSVADWKLEKPTYLDYGEFFNVPRELSAGINTWVKGDKKFEVAKKENAWVVSYGEPKAYYTIPNAKAYADYNILGADGRYGYFCYEATLIRMDLATGEVERLLHYPIYDAADFRLYNNLVVYYYIDVNDELEIGRIYLPELKYDSLQKLQGEFYGLAVNGIDNTEDPLVFSMYNPDMIDLLKAELANPNSQYKQMWINGGTTCYDFSEYWETEDGVAQILMNPGFLHYIQDTSGVRAFLQCTYNLSDGSLTKKTGIIDNCFHGSGYPHDHFNPEITTADPVEVIMGQKKDLLNQMPEIFGTETTQADILLLPDVDSNSYLYVKTDGDYKKILNTPVSLAVNAGSGAICISGDKQTVFAIHYEDAQPVEIYRATNNTITVTDRIFDFNFNCERPWLIIQDGDTLVQLDLIAGKSRELVRHPYILPYYYVDPDETTVYFDVAVGLYVSGFTIDMETGELREDYRL